MWQKSAFVVFHIMKYYPNTYENLSGQNSDFLAQLRLLWLFFFSDLICSYSKFGKCMRWWYKLFFEIVNENDVNGGLCSSSVRKEIQRTLHTQVVAPHF